MKRLLFILGSFLLLANASSAQSKDVLREGSKLTYLVNASGEEYDFIVTVKKLSEEGAIVFDWEMTDPVNNSGTITISKDAAENSFAWYNFFSGGELKLDQQTSVFISFMLNLDIAATDEGNHLSKNIKLASISDSGESFLVKTKTGNFSYDEDGVKKTIKTVVLQNESGDKTVTIYNESTHAFIVSMSIGFDIELKKVEY